MEKQDQGFPLTWYSLGDEFPSKTMFSMKDIAEFVQNLHTYHGIRRNGLPCDIALWVSALGIDQDICVKKRAHRALASSRSNT